MADQDDLAARSMMFLGLVMHLAHQRAGCIKEIEIAAFGIGRHVLGNAMGGKHDRAIVVGDFVEFLDKHRALGFQRFHNEPVVHDFVTHIDRRTVLFEGALDDLDRAIDAGTEATGACKQDAQGGLMCCSVHDVATLSHPMGVCDQLWSPTALFAAGWATIVAARSHKRSC